MWVGARRNANARPKGRKKGTGDRGTGEARSAGFLESFGATRTLSNESRSPRLSFRRRRPSDLCRCRDPWRRLRNLLAQGRCHDALNGPHPNPFLFREAPRHTPSTRGGRGADRRISVAELGGGSLPRTHAPVWGEEILRSRPWNGARLVSRGRSLRKSTKVVVYLRVRYEQKRGAGSQVWDPAPRACGEVVPVARPAA